MNRTTVATSILCALAVALVPGLGCKREHAAVIPSQPGPASSPVAMARVAPADESLAPDLPAGWTASAGNGMRFATLKPSAPGKLDVSVIVLPGPAGGELANVNRWRGQIGLPPIDEATRAQTRKQVESKAGPSRSTSSPARPRASSTCWPGCCTSADEAGS